MVKRFLFGIIALSLVAGTDCAGISPTIPAGEIKISYFSVTEGLRKAEVRGSYIAMVSKDWVQCYRKKLNEPFEKLKLPPRLPAVKIAPDEGILDLVELLEKEGFYSLKAANLKKYTIENMERDDFRTRVLTIERNGFSYTVAMEDLPQEEQKTFLWIKNIFLKNYAELESWNTEIIYDWKDFIKRKLQEQQE